MRATAYWLDRLSAGLNRIALWAAVGSLLSLVAIAGWQVVARYVLDQPPAWTEELARFMMVWAGLLGASCAFRAKTDPSLFPAARERVDGVGRVFAVIRTVGTIVFVAPILWYCVIGINGKVSTGYIARNAKQLTETMDLSMAVFAVAIPVGFTLIAIHALAQAATALSRREVT